MGKSSKKSGVKVAPTAVSVSEGKSGKKGKRDAEGEIEKAVSAKKQKAVHVKVEPVKKQPPPKKVHSPSISEGKSGKKGKRDAEGEIEKAVSAKKQQTVPVAETVKKQPPPESNTSSGKRNADEIEKAVSAKKRKAVPVKVEPVKKQPPPKKVKVQPKNVTQPKKVCTEPAKEETSDDSSDETSSDDDNNAKEVQPAKTAALKKKEESSDSSESESEFHSDSDEHVIAKRPLATEKKNGQAKTPTINESQATRSKTIFVRNLSFSIRREQVKQFFEEAGEVVDVRLSTFEDGSFKGYGHVEFATAEAAQKALGFACRNLMGRPVWVELARQRGAYTPGSGRDNSSFKSAPRSGKTLYIEGFDKSIGEDQIRTALQEHFRSCGEITYISIPKDYKTGASKGIAFIDFKDPDSLVKAYQLNASELGGRLLYVDQAKTRPGNNSDGGFSRHGSFSGRGGSDRGRGGGRGCGFGGRGGSGDRGRGGRGTPFRQNAGTASTGKKITFADDD